AAPADYDGDGKADGCVYQQSTGLWIILPSGSLTPSGYVPVSGVFGGPGFVPVPADYTGEGMADMAVYDEVTGNWYIVAIDGTRVAWPVHHGGYGFIPVKP
ncbi:FG-GAP repeat domain-containing protein, partial [Verrucomicrobiota bacterium]